MWFWEAGVRADIPASPRSCPSECFLVAHPEEKEHSLSATTCPKPQAFNLNLRRPRSPKLHMRKTGQRGKRVC